MARIYFHEDDFCQIEILPAENLSFCLEQAERISAFAGEHKAGLGYSEVFMRKDAPVSLYSKSITADTLQEYLGEILPEFDEVYTGYGTHEEKCSFTRAFGKDTNTVVFYSNKEALANHIWLTLDIMKSDDIVIARSILDALAKINDFIIADWGWAFVEPIKNIRSIDSYLNMRLKEFA